MNARVILVSCVCALFFSLPVRADVLDVGGPNPDHPTIVSAVAAAAEGDVIRVFSGTYAFFAVDGKSLAIIGVGCVAVTGTVRVRNIAADQSVLISGLDMAGADSRGFVAHDCQGLVAVQDCTMTGDYESGVGARQGGYAVRCDQLVLVESVSVGYAGAGQGADGFLAEQSSVSAYGCTFTGGTGGESANWGYLGGSGYANLDSSTLFAARCIFRGGRGGVPYDCEEGVVSGNGGHGLNIPSGQVSLLHNTFVPGPGGGNTFCPPGNPGQDVFGFATMFPGTLTRTELPAITTDAAAGDVRFWGPPGHSVRFAASSVAGFRYLPALAGVLHPDPPALAFVALAGTISGLGFVDYTFDLPDLPPFGHVVWTTQAVVRDPGTDDFTLSSPRWVVILDGAL